MRQSLAFAVAAAFAVATAHASNASASDAYPCGPIRLHPVYSQWIQTCPDWSPDGWIPVYDSPYTTSPIIDWIYAPGDDWYVWQCQTTSVHTLGGAKNNWWAGTRGDGRYTGGRGRSGWVPETYFRGGADFEPDAALRRQTSTGIWCFA
jgi:hypothetical protein